MKKLIMVFIVLTFVLLLAPYSLAQPDINGFTVLGMRNGHGYYISNSMMSWTTSLNLCLTVNGHLATITSAEEDSFIWSHVSEYVGQSAAWIGFTDSRVEDQWEWITGEPVTYTNWEPTQPDNSGGNQNFGVMRWVYGGKWDDMFDSCAVYCGYAVMEVENSRPPTSLPFVDNFDSPTLDSCWTWIREDTSHWSLTERPGWMRIVTQGGDINFGTNKNTLLRNRPQVSFRLETKLAIAPEISYQGAQMLIYRDDQSWIGIGLGCSAFRKVSSQAWTDGGLIDNWNVYVAYADTQVFLRLDVIDSLVTVFWSVDSSNWSLLRSGVVPWVLSSNVKIGFQPENYFDNVPEIPADFDYFRVDSLPGTAVCGEVSGVWDSTRSPYYVTCDVTVPSGQTLEIQPGVQVLFTGHYKFNVFGNLQANGTEQDSIVFTRAFPTEESKWSGIRFADEASDSSRLAYCVVEYGIHTEEPLGNNYGGGISIDRCDVSVQHSSIRHNYSENGGGVGVVGECNPVFSNCAIEYNSADPTTGSGGGIAHNPAPTNGGHITLDHCTIHHNTANNGGAIYQGRGNFHLFNCTIAENQAVIIGGAIVLWHSTPYTITLLNCISWENAAPSDSEFYFGEAAGSAIASYSNIQGGYPGEGNIDADPMFVDTANGDFHLQSGSPCIDTGDPTTPLDPDSTIADMGAFPFANPNLTVRPTSLDFDLIDLGTDSVLNVSLYNPTDMPIPILGFTLSEPAFAIDTVGLNGQIASSASYLMHVTFAAAQMGTYVDTLFIHAQQPDSVIAIALSGEAQILLPPVDSLVIKKGPMNGIQLNWAAVTHSVTGHPVENVVYMVYGSTDPEAQFQPFGYTATNSFVHSNTLSWQAKYYYYVTAMVSSSRSTSIGKYTTACLPILEK